MDVQCLFDLWDLTELSVRKAKKIGTRLAQTTAMMHRADIQPTSVMPILLIETKVISKDPRTM